MLALALGRVIKHLPLAPTTALVEVGTWRSDAVRRTTDDLIDPRPGTSPAKDQGVHLFTGNSSFDLYVLVPKESSGRSVGVELADGKASRNSWSLWFLGFGNIHGPRLCGVPAGDT